MLKITTREHSGAITFILEGRLCGPWAKEAELAWTRLLESSPQAEIRLDLAGVTFIDRAGETLLTAMLSRGTKVRASGVLISHFVEEVQQRVSELASQRVFKPSRGTPESA